MRHFSLLLFPSALARIGEANLSGPRSTVRAETILQTGFSPKPTAKAQLGQQANNIFVRQAYAETCGYVGAFPISCAAGLQCAVDTLYNAGGCCAGGGCYLATTCLNADAVQYACDANCLGNPRNMFCTDLNYPFCQPLIFNYATPYTGYLCAAYTEGMVYTVTPNNAITPEVLVYHTSAAPQSQQAAGTVTVYPSSGGNSGNGNDNNINGNNNYQYNGNITVVNSKGTAVRTVGSETTLLRWLSQSGAFAVILNLVL